MQDGIVFEGLDRLLNVLVRHAPNLDYVTLDEVTHRHTRVQAARVNSSPNDRSDSLDSIHAVPAPGKALHPLDNAPVALSVRPLGAYGTNHSEIQITAEPSATEPGLYEATYVPRDSGAYQARATVVGTAVTVDIVAGGMGRWEASSVVALREGAFPCPVCGTLVDGQAESYEICPVCGWEDDPVQREDPAYTGGANAPALAGARAAWRSRA